MSDAALLLLALTSLAVGARLLRSGQRVPVYLELRFPRTVDAGQVVTAVRTLSGLLPPMWRRVVFGSPVVTLEVNATATGITHRLSLPPERVDQVVRQLTAAIPGLRVDASTPPPFAPTLTRELRLTGSGELRTDVTPAANAGLLAALQPLRRGEQIIVQYVIAPVGMPLARRVRLQGGELQLLQHHHRHPRDLRDEGHVEPDLEVALRVGVSASGSRTGQLVGRVLGAFHATGTAEARLSRRLIPSQLASRSLTRQLLTRSGSSILRADELAATLPIPIDGPSLPGLSLVGARPLPPASEIPSSGLVLGDWGSTDEARPLALDFDELRRGLHICAPTGAGKSTLLVNIALQLIHAGQPVVFVDSKGDSVMDIADRLPKDRVADALLFDPSSPEPIGFNLIGGASDADLVTEHVTAGFRARYGQAGLGPRSEDLLRSALVTLARRPGYTICEIEPLLSNPVFRQRLIGDLDEPVLEGFWAWFGSLSDAARAEAVAPLANKLRTYTLSRRTRTVVGQTAGLDLHAALQPRRVTLISLSRGTIGEDAAALIGGAIVSRLWQVIQGRAGVPAHERVPATVILDEFADFATAPVAFETAIAQSRGYGVAWVLAHQNLGQLEPRLRQAVLANARSRLVMQTTASDAGVFAKEFAPHLKAADLQGLAAFEAYAGISAGAAVAPPASLRTRPAPEPTGSLAAVRAQSRKLGATSKEVDAAIRARLGNPQMRAPVGGRRRS